MKNLFKTFAVILFISNVVISNAQESSPSINDLENKLLSFQKENNQREIARCEAQLGFLYHDANNISKALDYLQKSIKINEQLGNENAVKTLSSNIGIFYADAENYDQALIYFKKSLKINESQGEKTDQLGDLINISQTLQSQHNYAESNKYAEKASSLAQELSDMNSLKTAFSLIYENYDKLGNSAKSHEYFDLANSIKSKLQKDELNKYESRTKEAEAVVSAKESELKSKDLKIEKISREQQLSMQLLEQQKEVSELKETEYKAKEKLEKEQQRNTYRIIALMGFILLIVLSSLFFIFKQLREKKKANLMLELSNKQIIEQKIEIESQRDIANQQKKKITDSIQYAQRIQKAVLPPVSAFEKILPNHFILFKPRDIVSGDFYWMTEKEGVAIIVAADCTGHGVPGAFMSMLGVAFLNDIVNKITLNKHFRALQANEILNQLRDYIIQSLHQSGNINESKDGMDIALCIIDFENGQMQFAGAHNPVYIIRNGELKIIEADKMPIGYYKNATASFTNNEIALKQNDLIYIFSDGYFDQMGGLNKMKMFSANFRKYLLEIYSLPLIEQKSLLNEYYEKWKGENEQIDDVLIIGFKFEPEKSLAQKTQGFNWSNKKILIAEDVDINLFLLVEALKATKAEITRAKNGLEAVELTKINSYDLILMDIRMPIMDGIEATKEIRKFNNTTPIIAQTAQSENDDLDNITAAGCNDYVAKPINLKQFLTVVNKHISK
jgi:CheY-like chemotaxis protein